MSHDQNKAPACRPSLCKWLISFAVFLAIIALIAAGVALQQTHQIRSQLTQAVQQINATQQAQQQFQHQFTERFQQKEAQLNQLISQSTNLSAEQAKAEAQYLTNLAELNLKYGANIDHALQLLQIALQQLTPFNTPDITPLQQIIKARIKQLQQIPQTNPISLLNALDNMMLQIEKIPTIPSLPTPPADTASTETTDQTTWWNRVKHSLSKMKSFVVVRKSDDTHPFALTPDERLLIKQSILIKLSLAQWAVLNKQQDTYQQSLTTAKKILTGLPWDPRQSQQIQNAIDQLLTVSLQPKLFF